MPRPPPPRAVLFALVGLVASYDGRAARSAPGPECFDLDGSNPDGAAVLAVTRELLDAALRVDVEGVFALASQSFVGTIDTPGLRTVLQQSLYHGYTPAALDRVRMVRVKTAPKGGRHEAVCGSSPSQSGWFSYSSRVPGEQIVLFGEGPRPGRAQERAQLTVVLAREGGRHRAVNVFMNAATRAGRTASDYLAAGREAEKRGKPRIAWFQYRTARDLSFVSGHLRTGVWTQATEAWQGLKVFDIPNRSPTPWWSRRAGSLVVYHLDMWESSGRVGLLVEYVSRDPGDLSVVANEADALMEYMTAHFPEYADFFGTAYFSPLEETPELGEPTEPRPVTLRSFP